MGLPLVSIRMIRTRYIVCYDISNPKRLRAVCKVCESFGSRLQYSVFECFLGGPQLWKMKAILQKIIHHEEDQVLFISLGLESSQRPVKIEYLGQSYSVKTRITVI